MPAVVIKLPRASALTEIEILEMTEEFLCGKYKLYGGVFFVDEFPITIDGKHDRVKLESIANNFQKEQSLSNNQRKFVSKKS